MENKLSVCVLCEGSLFRKWKTKLEFTLLIKCDERHTSSTNFVWSIFHVYKCNGYSMKL
jgi:hypothetical protein